MPQSQHTNHPPRLLVGATGSVASIKLTLLVEKIKKSIPNVEVKVIATQHALHFFDRSAVDAEVLVDSDEWKTWKSRDDPVLHIELRKWADAIVIAPLDANTMAKLAGGHSDNLLTCVLRAWDPTKPVIVCPAMNTFMWTHPFTERHLDTLKGFLGYSVINPISKKLACGDTGVGAMAEVDTIVEKVCSLFDEQSESSR
ncbi:Phosphopantothenoylcysteine decarboxylase [Cladochytrium replicatum]|nr:Phosphopantothenoylcysteine decarboxylase [Cladochytrium replicatum]